MGPRKRKISDTAESEPQAPKKKTRQRRKRNAPSTADTNAEIVATVANGEQIQDDQVPVQTSEPVAEEVEFAKKRRRASTPEEDRNHQIDITKTLVGELTANSRRGKKSKLGERMDNIDWSEVRRRRKQDEAERVERAMNPPSRQQEVEDRPRQGEEAEEEEEIPATIDHGPRLKLVNGQMVVDEESMTVNRHAVPNDDIEAIEDNDITRRLTNHSYINSNRRDPVERARSSNKADPWSGAETEAFYDALRGFGTDFFLISKMFPGKTRNHVKRKFVREEKAHPDLIRRALIHESVEMDMDVFLQASNRKDEDYKDPDEIEKELRLAREEQIAEIEREKAERAEKKRLKQEKAREKAEAQAQPKKKRRERKKKQKKDRAEPAAAETENVAPTEAGETVVEVD